MRPQLDGGGVGRSTALEIDEFAFRGSANPITEGLKASAAAKFKDKVYSIVDS